MTAGLPGAGIGGLFYLASTLLLPVRGLVRRMRGQEDHVPWPAQTHSVLIAVGIVVVLWLAGWLLGQVVPDEFLVRNGAPGTVNGRSMRSVIPMATFAVAAATLVGVLAAVEVAHHVQARGWKRAGRRSRREES